VDRAIDLGITLFDTADTYGNRGGSERFLGEILGDRRKHIVLASKFGMAMDDEGHLRGGSRRYVMSAVEDSLRRLKTDWIDLYQFHIPDPETPIDETLRALDDLVTQGKVRYLGWSNVAGWQLAEAVVTARMSGMSSFVSTQAEYNILDSAARQELIPACDALDVSLLPFYPLAGGLLTGKYSRNAALPEGTRLANTPRLANRYVTNANWTRLEALEAFCSERDRTLLELAFAWLLAQPVTGSVIAGATNPEQVEANVKAGEWELGEEDLAKVDAILSVAA
jgi:aryl-alcohol dehydrogenase-like predicted oxidoreductase